MRRNTCVLFMAALASGLDAAACDLCSVYNVNAAEGSRNRGFSISLAEQFTDFGTLQEEGREVANPTGQYLNSSISQVVPGYTFNDWASVQVSLPIIYREFKRPEGFALDRGHESGIGDLSLLGVFTPVRIEHMHSTFNWAVFGGVKFPTGDSDRLKEELNEVEVPGAPESGVHGHDIALGSGSYDGLVGTAIYARYQRVFFRASMNYSIRSCGDFDYRYANDLMWSGGPGAFLVLNENWTASLQFVVSGEDKGLDHFRGDRAEDTGITSVYLGPQFNVTWSDKLSVELGVDVPVLLENTALQIVPDYRVRAAITYRF
ncbi:MAG TPA: hypothetical protein VGF13_01940 [Verrucomicrobiae bacterium]